MNQGGTADLQNQTKLLLDRRARSPRLTKPIKEIIADSGSGTADNDPGTSTTVLLKTLAFDST